MKSALWVVALLCLSACADTRQYSSSAPLSSELHDSGFLGDLYPKLQKGEGDQPLLLYRNPKFDAPAAVAAFTQILVEPAVMFAPPDSNMAKLSDADRAKVAGAIDAQLREQLSRDYELVAAPSEKALRIQVAVVEVDPSSGVLEGLSYVPLPLGVPGAKIAVVQLDNLMTGKPPFSGDITIEGKLSDSSSGEIVAAMVDRRSGARKPLIGLFEPATYDSWADVDASIRYFAERIRFNLCRRRGGSDCVEPKA